MHIPIIDDQNTALKRIAAASFAGFSIGCGLGMIGSIVAIGTFANNCAGSLCYRMAQVAPKFNCIVKEHGDGCEPVCPSKKNLTDLYDAAHELYTPCFYRAKQADDFYHTHSRDWSSFASYTLTSALVGAGIGLIAQSVREINRYYQSPPSCRNSAEDVEQGCYEPPEMVVQVKQPRFFQPKVADTSLNQQQLKIQDSSTMRMGAS